MTDNYFAYGSNMDPTRMRQRCPHARALGVAVLGGHEVVIGHRGVATIVPCTERVTYGVLWHLTAGDAATLDRIEGVRQGRYRREWLAVEFGHEEVTALMYVEEFMAVAAPRPGYLETVLVGARHFGLPPDYIDQIAALAAL